MPITVTAYERPPYPAPHSFLLLVVLTLIICMVLNISSLVLGIPALIFSLSVSVICMILLLPCTVILFLPLSQSVHAVERKQWKAANSYGKVALYLIIANWIYVLGAALLATGLTMGFLCRYDCGD